MEGGAEGGQRRGRDKTEGERRQRKGEGNREQEGKGETLAIIGSVPKCSQSLGLNWYQDRAGSPT